MLKPSLSALGNSPNRVWQLLCLVYDIANTAAIALIMLCKRWLCAAEFYWDSSQYLWDSRNQWAESCHHRMGLQSLGSEVRWTWDYFQMPPLNNYVTRGKLLHLSRPVFSLVKLDWRCNLYILACYKVELRESMRSPCPSHWQLISHLLAII